MKSYFKRQFLLHALVATGVLMLRCQLTAQTFKSLYSFTAGNDGAAPIAGVILSNETLYGTTEDGFFEENDGFLSAGDVFFVSLDGSDFTPVHDFSGFPLVWGGVILSGNTLYGTTVYGGSSGSGSVFAVNRGGTGFTNLHSFAASTYSSDYENDTNSDGSFIADGLVLLGTTLFGTARVGGSTGNGTVFAVSTDGMGFTNLHNFIGNDGSQSFGGLIPSENILYGTTELGGSYDSGTIFAIKSDGSGFTNLYSFSALVGETNGDGAEPQGTLILSGNTLYGTASAGGTGGNGTIFTIRTDGSGFTNLHSFASGRNVSMYTVSNIDGAAPYAGLTLSGNTLYGTAMSGGPNAAGTIFTINTDGTFFKNLYFFTGLSDGDSPSGVLALSSNTFYGTTIGGGNFDHGTIFSLSLPPPPLTIYPSGNNVILSWPTPDAGCVLQCATSFGATNWCAVSTTPVMVNGRQTVTNPISASQMFYRLTQ